MADSITFSKTRLIYFENNPDTITGANLDAKVTIPDNKNIKLAANSQYQICQIAPNTTGWHKLPMNTYGCAMTEAEIGFLYHAATEFWPVKMQVTVGHCIPLAKYPSTTNATQLSFNNTIYSLFYKNYDTKYVISDPLFYNSIDDAINFYRTFDGSSFKDNKRLMLPQPSIYYKIPAVTTDKDATIVAKKDDNVYKDSYPLTATAALGAINFIQDVDYGAVKPVGNVCTLLDYKKMYYPAFQQDNENLYALYPGENIFTESYSCDKTKNNVINLSQPTFNKHYMDTDGRGYGINSNTVFDSEWLLHQTCFIASRGPTDRASYGLGDTPEHHRTHNIDPNSFYEQGPPEIYCKGIPILDPTDNVVPHHFLASCTWELTICFNRYQPSIPRNLRWGYYNREFLQELDTIITSGNKKTPKYKTRPVGIRSWPQRLFNDSHWEGNMYWQSRTNPTDNQQDFTDPIYPPYQTATSGVVTADERNSKALIGNELDQNELIQSTSKQIPTKSWYPTYVTEPTQAIANRTRSKTRKRNVSPKDSIHMETDDLSTFVVT